MAMAAFWRLARWVEVGGGKLIVLPSIRRYCGVSRGLPLATVKANIAAPSQHITASARVPKLS